MAENESGVTWFEDEDWIGSEIVFKDPTVSKWKITRKIAEHEMCVAEYDVSASKMESSCRGVFVCSSLDRPGQEAVVKIRMQIPYYNTAHRRPSKRAAQAHPEVHRRTKIEVEGLQRLTTGGCTSAPTLFAWKHENQNDDGFVPGGYIDYILMQYVPGLNVASSWYGGRMDREERDELREAFKAAWLDCTACGIISLDPAIRNLLWDRKNQKCYIIDWESWYESAPEDVWTDGIWIDWNLASYRGGDYHDKSTWTL